MKKKIKLFDNFYALKEGALKVGNDIVVADLHLGYEQAMVDSGMLVPKYQWHVLKEKLENMKGKRIILNGDIKYEFSRNNLQEKNEGHKLFKLLQKNFDETILIRGNHDNYLMNIAKDYGIKQVDKLELSNALIFHGHINHRFGKKTFVIGNDHPAINLKDEVGVSMKLPCFLYSKKLVVIPAFSPLFAGVDILSMNNEDFLSPVLQKHGSDSMKVITISDYGLTKLPEVSKLKALPL